MLYGPTVNLNGASRESLLDQYRAVTEAASALMDAMANACPHGRDYQTVPGSYYASDRKEWESRLRQVDDIRREWLRIAERLATEA